MALDTGINTHPRIDRSLCGEPVALGPNTATVRLQTAEVMAADARGLVHGGFVFGAADYAAMLAVNDPNVVLASSECRFLAPVVVGQVVILVAEVAEARGRKRTVRVSGMEGERSVFEGSFVAAVLDRHVLDPAPLTPRSPE